LWQAKIGVIMIITKGRERRTETIELITGKESKQDGS
jgi:hypothetical protein